MLGGLRRSLARYHRAGTRRQEARGYNKAVGEVKREAKELGPGDAARPQRETT